MFGNCAKSAPDRISRVTCATSASHLPQSTRRAALPSKEHTTRLRAERLWSSIVCLISADDNAGRGGWLPVGGMGGGGAPDSHPPPPPPPPFLANFHRQEGGCLASIALQPGEN